MQNSIKCIPTANLLVKRAPGKVRQDESSLVNLGAVVSAELVLLLLGPLPERLADVTLAVLAADEETNLAGGVGGDGGVGVTDGGENLLARLDKVGDERKVEPLVLSCLSNFVSKRSREKLIHWACVRMGKSQEKDGQDGKQKNQYKKKIPFLPAGIQPVELIARVDRESLKREPTTLCGDHTTLLRRVSRLFILSNRRLNAYPKSSE